MAGRTIGVATSLDEPGAVFADAAEGGVSGCDRLEPDLGIGESIPT